MISLENVSFGYGRETVLENVCLEIPGGIFLPFAGPNGAGKTTLLRGILGLLKPQKGTVRFSHARIRLGYVPQHKAFDPLFPLTVREIVAMGFYPSLGFWKNPGAAQRAEMESILEELNLTPHAGKNYRDLSGGTKQKVLIARALVSGADALVMDEPVSELDEAAEREVFSHLGRLVTREGKAVLIAHHGMNSYLREMAPRLCLVEHGKVRLIEASSYGNGKGH